MPFIVLFTTAVSLIALVIVIIMIIVDADEGALSFVSSFFIIMLGILSCVIIANRDDTKIESTQPLKPELKIECIDTKCDTSYIYKNPIL